MIFKEKSGKEFGFDPGLISGYVVVNLDDCFEIQIFFNSPGGTSLSLKSNEVDEEIWLKIIQCVRNKCGQ